MQESLVLAALQMALSCRKIKAGVIYHSDRGGQYAGLRYRDRLAKVGKLQSMSRADNCYDDAFMESSFGTIKTELEHFLAQLPRLWKQGGVRPTHREVSSNAGDYRTRKDPFEGTWPEVLTWLEKEPDATAKTLFQRLQKERPGKYSDGQLRTLQRRIREWRHIMAKQLIYNSSAS